MDIGLTHIDKCRYEIREQKGVPVWYTVIYRPISSTALTYRLRPSWHSVFWLSSIYKELFHVAPKFQAAIAGQCLSRILMF
jgi:hypothetical protein